LYNNSIYRRANFIFGVYYCRYIALKVCGLRGIKGILTAFAPLVYQYISFYDCDTFSGYFLIL
jgi:hypothetical protein